MADQTALQMALDLSATCKYLSLFCVFAAAVCTIVAWVLAPRDTAQTAAETAKALAAHPNLAPAAVDIPKVMDSAKGLIDSLGKASPFVAWLAAAVFFMAVAVFGVSDYAHKPADQPSNKTTDSGKGAGK
jgi:hypothetical protein